MNLFLEKLQGYGLKRVPIEDIRRFFFETRPELLNNPDRNIELLEVLKALAAQGSLTLPAPGSWEKFGVPAMPKWITLVVEKVSGGTDYRSIPWVPELGFWPELSVLQLEPMAAINAFLLRRRGPLRPVPLNERSLEIFGDEKRLSNLLKGSTSLFDGRLPLTALSTFHVVLPLPYRASGVTGAPVLVVENHHSYWSLGEWNQKARRYSAVIYGTGKQFHSSGKALAQTIFEVGGRGAEYVGDVDPEGIDIPLRFNRAQLEGMPTVQPAILFYEWLLQHGTRRMLSQRFERVLPLASAWLGDDLAKKMRVTWEQGNWIPQESLGFETLMESF